jgi:hypothetical protein
MPGFITDNELKTYVKAVFRKGSEFSSVWDVIIPEANTAAYWDIVYAWQKRGFTKTQIDQWDRGEEYQKYFGLWWCLEKASVMDPESAGSPHLEKFKLDRRWELSENKGPDGTGMSGGPILFTIGGEVQRPGSRYGQVRIGDLDTTKDLFSLDPDDPRRGTPTVF